MKRLVYWPGLPLFALLLLSLLAAAVLTPPTGADPLRQPPPPEGRTLGGHGATSAIPNSLFCNAGAITIPSSGAAAPYPADIIVSGLSGSITAVQVQITGLAHTWPEDIDLLLVGPNGNTVMLMSDAGYNLPISNVNLGFADGYPELPYLDVITSGTYSPTNFDFDPGGDPFPAPAPAGPYGNNLLTAFGGSSPNGTWHLYLVDDRDGEAGLVSSGWCLQLTTYATPTPTGTATMTATATRTPTATVTATATRTPTACPGGTSWQLVSAAPLSGASNQLNAIAVAGAGDVWAVGARGQAPPPASTTATTTATAESSPALIEHWNGSTWASIPNPTPGTLSNALLSVAVVGSNDVWAVGSYSNEGGYSRTLTEHWDGSAWSVVSSPSPGAGGNVLTGVAAAGPNDVWAVGYQYPTGAAFAQTVILHWDGTGWTQVASPNGGTRDNFLAGVAVAGASDVWAVGTYVTNLNVAQTLVLHWNGSAWSTVASPNAGSQTNNYLAGVAAGGPGTAWAVGYYVSGGARFTLVSQWNGTSWALVGSPSPGSADNRLAGVAVVSPNDVWAVGYTRNSGSGTVPRTLIEHWDGSTWSVVASPNAHAGTNQLAGLAVAATNDIWAVGFGVDPIELSARSLILHYTCLPPTVTPTVTAGPPSATATASPTVSPAPTVTRTSVATLTPTATATATLAMPTATPSPSGTPPPTTTPASTMPPPPPTATSTPTAIWTATPTPTPPRTATALGTGTLTPTAIVPTGSPSPTTAPPTRTPTPVSATLTPRSTDTPASSPSPTHTTGVPSPTATAGPPSRTPTMTLSATSTPTLPPSATASPPPTATACSLQFADVPSGSTFYLYIRCLACRGIVSGYPCGGPGEPCPGPYFRPNTNVTRGQVSKIIAESAGFADPVPSTQQTFADVAPGSPFHLWIERLSSHGIIGGYPCGGVAEPCVPPTNQPYFRPNNQVTRGQLAKIVSGAAGWTETPTGQTFADVPPGSTFYLYVERIASRGIVGGYACGSPGEPCLPPANRAYFRPNNATTRGQISKIATLAFFPGCSTPLHQ